MELQFRSCMLSNFLAFHTSGGISSRPAAFLFLIFLSTESSSCVNCPSLMSSWLQIIFAIGSSVTFWGFPSEFLKSYFYVRSRSSGLVALAVLFLLLILFTACHTILDCLSSTVSLILLIWFCMYSVCSFTYTLVSSFCAFLSFWALILVGFLLFQRIRFSRLHAFSNRWCFPWDSSLALCLVGVHFAAASMRTFAKLSYSSFRVSFFNISWSASNLFLSVDVYLSLISLMLSRG